MGQTNKTRHQPISSDWIWLLCSHPLTSHLIFSGTAHEMQHMICSRQEFWTPNAWVLALVRRLCLPQILSTPRRVRRGSNSPASIYHVGRLGRFQDAWINQKSHGIKHYYVLFFYVYIYMYIMHSQPMMLELEHSGILRDLPGTRAFDITDQRKCRSAKVGCLSCFSVGVWTRPLRIGIIIPCRLEPPKKHTPTSVSAWLLKRLKSMVEHIKSSPSLAI